MDDEEERWSIVRLLASAVLAALLVVVFAFGAAESSDTPDFPQWIEAIATLAAFAAASIAAVYAARAFRLETRREQSWIESQQQSQASLVAAWYEVRPLEVTQQGPFGTGRIVGMMAGDLQPGICVRNASNLPVYSLHAWVRREGEMFAEFAWDVLPPSLEPHWLPLSRGHVELLTREPSTLAPSVDIVFMDADGVDWRRSVVGRLTRSGGDVA